MATVTGLTAARMLEIENQSVVSGHVSGDNLVLVTHGGAQINAGSVRGIMGPAGGAFVICTSSTRPSFNAGEAGKAIYETDTKLVRVWTGTRFRCQEKIICTSSTRPTMASADEGVKIYETDSNMEFTWNGTAWVSPMNGLMPVGFEMTWPGDTDTVPPAFLVEDGTIKLRASYPDLFLVLGTKWNTGGETNDQFRLPNMHDKVHVGAGGTYAVGTYGGENTHLLTASEMPRHTHIQNPHNHAESAWNLADGLFTAAQFKANVAGSMLTGSFTSSDAAVNQDAGGSQPHNNMQAFAAKLVIIRAL